MAKPQEVENYEDYEDTATEQEVCPIAVAFDEGVEAEKDEDSIKMAMIEAGATFKNVTRMYNQFMIDAGLAVSAADRKKLVGDALQGRDLSTEEGLDDAITAVMEAVQGSTDRSAAALVRSYAKKNELEVFSKPKSAGTGASRPGFAAGYYKWLSENKHCAIEEATAYIMGEGDHEDTSENVKRHLSHYLGIWELVNKIANA